MEPRRFGAKESEGSSFTNWLWIIAIVMMIVLFVSAAMANAGTVKVSYREPADRDLVRCRITLQNAEGAAVDTKEITAFNNDQVHENVSLAYDTRVLQGSTGKVVGWCVDSSGQTSVDSTSLAAIFPDLAPLGPEFLDVQVVP